MPISADEERELKVELMRADLDLKKKQSFWETPRNIGLLIAATAAVAGALGFKLGQKEPMPQPPAQVLQLPPGTTITVPSAPAPK